MNMISTHRKIFLLTALFCMSAVLMAQTPKLISYQAVVRDASTQPIANTAVIVIMKINYLTTSGTLVFTETHNVNTNDYGLINIMLGNGTGSDLLEDIDWSVSPYYLNINIDGNDMDAVMLLSVPYAFYADEAGNVFSGDYNDLINLPNLGDYITDESDPVFIAHDAHAISSSKIINWDDAYSWGDHALAGYITGFTELDPVFDAHAANSISQGDMDNWDDAFGWGNHASAHYLTSETDPVFGAHIANTITSTDKAHWNTAYGWGDHSSEGYLDSKWSVSTDTIFVPAGTHVGIGTNSPKKSKLSVNADAGIGVDDPIFQVVNSTGVAVFAVYDDGSVDIKLLDSSVKASKGGFAIGGFDPSKGDTPTQPYINISPDSTRLYFNESAVKGAKGGFAIGGYDQTKGVMGKYVELRGERSGSGKSVFLGYLAGGDDGFSSTSNVAIGNNAGLSLKSGSANNVFIGEEAGMNASIYQNVFIGSGAGRNCISGYNNIYIGYESGSEGHGQYNIFIGDEAGRYNDGGYGNVFMGNDAGKNITTGDRNILMGSQAGDDLNDGMDNVVIGFGAGSGLVDANENTIIGSYAGNSIANAGTRNIFLGYYSGRALTSGSENIFIGTHRGPQTGSDNILIGTNYGTSYLATEANGILAIDNALPYNLTSSFLYGDMLNSRLTLNAYTGIRTAPDPAYGLKVNGSIFTSGTYQGSDERLKTNIETISDPLNKVLSLRGVSFEWNNNSPSPGTQSIGFIAQEAISIIPELVTKGSEYYAINYAPITALLVEAVKELKKENDILKSELSKVDELEAQIEELRKMIKGESTK